MSRARPVHAGSETRADAAHGRARCVVLCPADASPPPVLLAALRTRGVEPEHASDPFRAMLALTRQSPTHDTPERAWPPALIVVEPDRFTSATLEDLLDAAPRRAPGLVIWEYDPSARPPLRALVRSRRAAPAPTASPNAIPAPSVSRTARRPAPVPRPAPLRLTGDPAPTPPDSRDDAPPENLLSEEELTMLLADDPIDTDDR